MSKEKSCTKVILIKREQALKRRFHLLLLLTAVTLIVFACIVFTLNISAHDNQTEEPVNFTYYKSITIHYGDTLWNIAEEYMTEEYNSIAEYVSILKDINQLHTDDIHTGQNLMVAYNDTTFTK